jgi:hypothetical protein
VDDRSSVVVGDRPNTGDFPEYSVANAAEILMCLEQINNFVGHRVPFDTQSWFPNPSLAAVRRLVRRLFVSTF